MITVCFYGGLRRYGRRFRLHASTPAEALHALFSQVRGLREYVRTGVYQVRWRGQDQSADSIHDAFALPGSGVLHIVPRVAGAGGNGVLQTIVGAVLVVVGVFTSWAGGSSLIVAGIGMMAGGIAQMLTKPPQLDNGSGEESSKNSAFSNLANTAAQGLPVPLAYGLVYAGSRVVSQGVESRRIGNGATDKTSGNSGNSVTQSIWRSAIKRGSDQAAPSEPPPPPVVGEAEPAPTIAVPNDPLAVDLTLAVEKSYTAGVAATAPNGQRYNTDFADDSVRARNYTASFAVQ